MTRSPDDLAHHWWYWLVLGFMLGTLFGYLLGLT